MAKVTLTLLLLSVMLNAAISQTFQYSRGWTNGKRSDDSSVLSLPELKNTDSAIPSLVLHTAESLSRFCCEVNCGSETILKLLRVNGKSQLYLVPCEILRARRRSTSQEKQQDISPADGHYRRSLSTEYDGNNDNY